MAFISYSVNAYGPMNSSVNMRLFLFRLVFLFSFPLIFTFYHIFYSSSFPPSHPSPHSWHSSAVFLPRLTHSPHGGPPRHLSAFLRLAHGGHLIWLIAYLPFEVRIQRALAGVLDEYEGEDVASDVGGVELGEEDRLGSDSDALELS